MSLAPHLKPAFFCWPAIVAFCLLSFNQNLSAQRVIFQNNFDGLTAGPYTDADLDQDFDEPNFNNGVTEGRVSVVSGAEAFGGNGSALAVVYPANEYGTRGTGAQWRLSFDESFEEATLSYRVRFAPGFDFVRGGKLPGLAGGTAPTGSTQANGFNGWTGRMMWRTDFNGVSGQPQQPVTGGITYTKHTTSGFTMDGRQEDRTRWTDADGSNTVMVADRWFQITQRIKMNTPGEFDGIQQIWLDGNLVLNEQNLRYRLTDQFAIDQMYFSTFYGGGEDWQTSKDEVAFFDDFVITVPTVETPNDGSLTVPGSFATIAAAVNAASPGDTIQVSGTVIENVLLEKSVCIEGDETTVIRAANSNLPTFTIDADDVIIKGLTVEGGEQGIVLEAGSQDVLLQDLFVSDADDIGILVRTRCDGFQADNVEIRENGFDGMRIQFNENITLNNCFSNRNGGSGFRLIQTNLATLTSNRTFLNGLHGFRIRGNDVTLVDNDSIRNDIRGFSMEPGNNLILINNLARDNGSHGFNFQNVTNSLIFDNRARFNLGNGIRVWDNSNFNLLDDNNSTGNLGHGILLGLSNNNEIVNSFVFENLNSGLLLASSTSSNFVTSNIFRSNANFGIGDFGSNNDTDGNSLEDNGR